MLCISLSQSEADTNSVREVKEIILRLLIKEKGKIEHPCLIKMVERMMPYNLTEEHVQGQDNKVADFG